ncbi:thiamine phosphate synthase [bacterium]|nr:thiamine phosphate synthase [bacterium]
MEIENRLARFKKVDLYPVITTLFCPRQNSVCVCEAVLAGGAKIVQLREKEKSKKELFALGRTFRELTRQYGALLIINDYLDIALAVKADGVHLGQEDFPIAAARGILPDMLLGVSTHNCEEAMLAEQAGADYINIGPIFSTETKKTGQNALGVDQIPAISQAVQLPYTVMGGIKQNNLAQVLRTGARRIAMVTEITQARNITEQVKDLRYEITSAF